MPKKNAEKQNDKKLGDDILIPAEENLAPEKVEAGAQLPAKVAPQRKGFEEEIDNDDLVVPRAKLMQPTSPEIADGLDVKTGDVINGLTKEVLSATFIPIFWTKTFIRFNPRKDTDPGFDPAFGKGDVIWKTNDRQDPRVIEECAWGPNNEPPIATTFLNFFSKFDNQNMPLMLSFSKTSYKAGKELLSLCKFLPGNMFSRRYKLSTIIDSNDSGTFAVLKVNAAGKVEGGDYELCEALHTAFVHQKDRIVTDEESDNNDLDLEPEIPF